jgi:dTDP-4-dehydrorhamnose reductase
VINPNTVSILDGIKRRATRAGSTVVAEISDDVSAAVRMFGEQAPDVVITCGATTSTEAADRVRNAHS